MSGGKKQINFFHRVSLNGGADENVVRKGVSIYPLDYSPINVYGKVVYRALKEADSGKLCRKPRGFKLDFESLHILLNSF